MAMTNLGGFKVCGKRGSTNFIDVKRPKLKNGKFVCEMKLVLCDEPKDGKIEYGICVVDKKDCPITKISL